MLHSSLVKQYTGTILVVEDDEDLRTGLLFALEQEGYSVRAATSIAEAADISGRDRFDLLILDVMLPDGNGFDFCRRIRSRPRQAGTPNTVPVIFLTARDDELDIVRGLDIGGDDYIAKPFRVRELLSRVRARMRRIEYPGTETDEGPAAGGIRVDRHKVRLEKNGETVPLTSGEYRLLLALMEHAGQTLTREQLVDRLLGVQDAAVDDNTLSVYIRRLREKVEDDPSSPRYIVTVRGIGYRYEAPG